MTPSGETRPTDPDVMPFAGQDLRCPACDYDLRAATSDRCSECGAQIDLAKLRVSAVPWAHRHEIGPGRAFLATVLAVHLRPRQFAVNVAGPLRLRDARRFQNVVVWLTFVPLALLWLGIYFADWYSRRLRWTRHTTANWFTSAPGGWIGEWLWVACVTICLWVFLKLATGVVTYFAYGHSLSSPRMSRVNAVLYYACAPLAWTPVSIILVLLNVWVGNSWLATAPQGAPIAFLLGGVTVISIVLQLCLWWFNSVRFLRRAVGSPSIQVLASAFLLPLLWVALLIVAIGIPSFFLAAVLLMLRSLS